MIFADRLWPILPVCSRTRECTLGSSIFCCSSFALRCHCLPYGKSPSLLECFLDILSFQLLGVSVHARSFQDARFNFFFIRCRLPRGWIPRYRPCFLYWVSHPRTADEKVAVLDGRLYVSDMLNILSINPVLFKPYGLR